MRDAFFIVEPDGTQLATVARMAVAGDLRAVAGAVLRLADAPEAYRRKPARGKVVVTAWAIQSGPRTGGSGRLP